MFMAVLMKVQVIIMTMACMTKTKFGGKFVRFGNGLQRLQIFALVSKTECLNLSIGASGQQTHVRSRPGMTTQRFHPPPW